MSAILSFITIIFLVITSVFPDLNSIVVVNVYVLLVSISSLLNDTNVIPYPF